ncbi:MAG: M23 family metallopeptidase [Spirochaetia bacterium]|jgi:murein DD-endopeptidase MepM/ murein hydrolase activator NlpD|nr:M23 family metallopeptidase [Spirochaetia bacterium]
MRKFFRILALPLCLFAVFPGSLCAGPAAETIVPESPARAPLVFTVPESLVQGDILCVLARSPQANRIRGIFADLSGGDGKKVLSLGGFLLSPRGEAASAPNGGGAAPETGETWAAIGGISSVQAPGDYSLSLRAVCEGGEEEVFSASVRVLGRDFLGEDIPLNRAMSSLRADSDPRKAAESRELWELLVKTEASSVYHTGRLSPPVAGGFRESAFFGDRRTFLYTDGGKAASIHYGLDYATPRGTPVYAAGAGRVVMAKERVLTGFSVVIEHLPGVYSLYYHLDKIGVKPDQIVKTGEKIGESGFTGLATGPHLHWEVRAAANAVEPKNLLERALVPGE